MRISIDGAGWRLDGAPPHPGSSAEGLLMNVRMVNCVFEDDRPAAQRPAALDGFDADANTDAFVARIGDYAACGVRAFTVGLQGGTPGYEGAINSAFDADGGLRAGYLARLARVVDAADAAGCAVILSCLYQRQHSHARSLCDAGAVRAAVVHTARWVADRGFDNVVLEVANEFAHAGFAHWPCGDWLRTPQAQAELIDAARDAAPGLLVSTSGMGAGHAFAPVAEVADFVTIHFNNTEVDAIPDRVAGSRGYGKPVVCNEDDKIGPVGAEAARVSVVSGRGWGFMHSAQNQSAPFVFAGRDDDPEVYDGLTRLTTPGANAGAPGASPVFALITQPKDGDTVAAGAALTVRASLTGTATLDGARLEIHAGERLVGVCAEAPWRVRWTGVPAGRHDLVAVLRDGDGAERARSRPVDIVVR